MSTSASAWYFLAFVLLVGIALDFARYLVATHFAPATRLRIKIPGRTHHHVTSLFRRRFMSKLKVGITLTVNAVANGYVDGPVAFSADNGATVTQVDAFNATVVLVNAGTTTIGARAIAAGNAIDATPVTEEAEAPATVLTITVA